MSLETKLKNEEIIPDVIDVAPASTLQIVFDSNTVTPGKELTPTQVKAAPEVSWTAESSDFYTLIFTDPDAPSRSNPIRREFLHWLIVNIPGAQISKGEVLAEFLGSGPPKDSDLHRYTFLLYKQKQKETFEWTKIPDNTRAGRRHFSARNFAKKYNMGEAVAANYYLAQWDEYVEEANIKLAGT